MKLLAKLALLAGATGAAATMYADPSTGASYNEAVARVITIRESVQTDFHHVLELQVRTRREKDVINLNCVNDKLVEMKPQMNVIDRLQIELQSGRESGDTSALRRRVSMRTRGPREPRCSGLNSGLNSGSRRELM